MQTGQGHHGFMSAPPAAGSHSPMRVGEGWRARGGGGWSAGSGRSEMARLQKDSWS